jgi:hypothetical protein
VAPAETSGPRASLAEDVIIGTGVLLFHEHRAKLTTINTELAEIAEIAEI